MSLLSLVRRARRAPQSSLTTEAVAGWHRRLVLWLLGLLALLLWAAGGMAVVQALAPARLQGEGRQALAALQAWLPGASVEVPAGAGIWHWQQAGVSWLAVRAQAAKPQWVDLCGDWQAKKDRADPRAIYDIAIGAGLASPAVQRFGLRRPVVLPDALAPLMPLARISGRLADAEHPAELRLWVGPDGNAASSPRAPWAVMGRVLAAGSGSAIPLDVSQPAWLMLGEQTAAMSGAKAYSHALRVQWQELAHCKAGQIRLDWYDAAALPPEAHSGPALLWARRGAEAHPKTMSLHAGRYSVPTQALPPLEDQALFEQALAQGVLAPLHDGRLGVGAPDQGRTGVLQPAQADVHKRLHRSDNGAFVLREVSLANQSQHWLAVRVRRPADGAALPADWHTWRARTSQELLGLQPGLPGVAVRLEAQLDPQWGEWLRVTPPQSWARGGPVTPQPVQLQLPVPAQGLELQVLGQVLAVEGATLRAQSDACLGPACAAASQIQQLRLAPSGLATEAWATLTLNPDGSFTRLRPERVQALQVKREGPGTWRWQARNEPAALSYPSEAQAQQARLDEGLLPHAEPARVTLASRQGQTLVLDSTPTALAQQVGLETLVGLGPEHAQSLLGNLQGLGTWGVGDAQAITTLDTTLQAMLTKVLRCVAQQDGHWQAGTGQCQTSGQSGPSTLRRSEAVLMNARTGEILALASGNPLPQGLTLMQLLNFDAFHRSRSPLMVGALHHSGDSTHAPGSTFKVFNALSLEAAAQQNKALKPLLAGVSPAQLEAFARGQGKALSMGSPCYPATCEQGVTNFGHPPRPAGAYAVGGVLGLRQALRASSNTWFAFMAEVADRTVTAGRLQARPLGSGALARERPLHALSEQLAFERPLRLDGGLLPPGLRLRPGDALLADASRLDPLEDVSGLRHQAIGMRMATTPLQMARVMAGVATGAVPAPRLLTSLNGVAATQEAGVPLAMNLAQIRAGMGDVVQSEGGTAYRAFQDDAKLRGLRPLVFGKTGSAPLASGGSKAVCDKEFAAGREPLACLNNAWFVGYVLPGALPGYSDPVAFAVRISHSRQTGGAKAAPVMAQFLASL